MNDYLYFGMMFTLISAYACSYDEASHQFVLMADEEMKCFTFSEPLQIIYMLVSSIGLVGFYPLATLLAPNFQFNNKALDIKYEQFDWTSSRTPYGWVFHILSGGWTKVLYSAYNMLDPSHFKSLSTTLLGPTLKYLSHGHLFECCSYLCLRNNVPYDKRNGW